MLTTWICLLFTNQSQAKNNFKLKVTSNDPNLLEGYLEASLSAQSNNYNLLTRIGMAYAQAGYFAKSQAYLTQAIRLDKNKPLAYGYLGALYNTMRLPHRAAPLLEKAIELGTNDPIVYRTLMGSYFLSQQYTKAIGMGKKILERNPKDFKAELMLGRCFQYNKQFQEALDTYNKVKQAFLEQGDSNTAVAIQAQYINHLQ